MSVWQPFFKSHLSYIDVNLMQYLLDLFDLIPKPKFVAFVSKRIIIHMKIISGSFAWRNVDSCLVRGEKAPTT